MKITAPGVYDMTADEYHADPCAEPSLSSSIAKMLVTPGTTPLHARHDCPRLNPAYEPEERSIFDLGAAAHSLFLGDPRDFEVCDFPDWRAKGAPFAREQARKAGKIPILTKHWERTIEMVQAARAQLDGHEEGPLFTDGKPEQTIVWRDGDVWCRARLDWMPKSANLYPDYKSTGASADADCWSRTMYGMGADMQAAFYLRGIRALRLSDRPEWRFVVQENYAPFALSVIGLTPGALDLAERQVERAIEIWGECRRRNTWPGYPRRTCWIEVPTYHEERIMARETREHEAEKLQQAREAQKPL